jgi:hypothetical protein
MSSAPTDINTITLGNTSLPCLKTGGKKLAP